MTPPRSLLFVYSAALVVCLCENAAAFVPSSTTTTTKCSRASSSIRYKYAKSNDNEIKDDFNNEMIKTEDLQATLVKDTKKKMDKKVDPASQLPLDKYHFTTKSKKELIFDERAGRFFETSIRPGSLHQLWQEYLHADDDKAAAASVPEQPAPTMEFSNDMIPTEILFGTASSSSFESSSSLLEDEAEECLVHTPYQDSCESTPWNVLEEADDQPMASKKKNKKKKTKNENKPETDAAPTWSPTTIVDKCYKAWNQRDMVAASECFTSSTKFKDYQYLGTMTNRQELQDHFTQQANLLPPNCKIVVDHLAYDEAKGKIATQWHVVRPNDGSTVKFTKGCSFYTLDKSSGLIVSGYRVSEMAVKPNRDAVNAVLSLAPASSSSSVTKEDASSSSSMEQESSVVERYFDAWNRRDMEAALECLAEDCVYQTEDPVFVGTLNGKEEIRDHLQRNANVLPAAAKIVLDDLAVDSFGQGRTIGTRWHLQVNGVTLPNLQGCSMYTTDPTTGKIKTALDITEAPVKLPREVLPFLWAPAVTIFDWN